MPQFLLVKLRSRAFFWQDFGVGGGVLMSRPSRLNPRLLQGLVLLSAALAGVRVPRSALPHRRVGRAPRPRALQTSAKLEVPIPPPADSQPDPLVEVAPAAHAPASPAPVSLAPPQFYVPSAALPAGKACRDCAHFSRCRTLICTLRGDETECDWAPSRFVPAPSTPQAPSPTATKATWSKPCRARCAHTGKRCDLPEHPTTQHRHGRTWFTAVAAEGQEYFPGAAALEASATRNQDGSPHA